MLNCHYDCTRMKPGLINLKDWIQPYKIWLWDCSHTQTSKITMNVEKNVLADQKWITIISSRTTNDQLTLFITHSSWFLMFALARPWWKVTDVSHKDRLKSITWSTHGSFFNFQTQTTFSNCKIFVNFVYRP